MIPAAVEAMGNRTALYVWLAAGFVLFFALEEFLNWHHSHTHSHSCSLLSPPHQHTICQQANDKSITHIDGLDRDLERSSECKIESFDENSEESTSQKLDDPQSMRDRVDKS
jgi:hypothetical protein